MFVRSRRAWHMLDGWWQIGCMGRRVGGAAAALLLVAAPAHGFRTIEDLPEFGEEDVSGWTHSEIEFQVSLDGLPPSLTEAQVSKAVDAALDAWSQSDCLPLTLRFRVGAANPEPMDGLNSIGWLDHWEDRGFSTTAAGNTDVQFLREGDRWAIAEADIYLNSEHFEWAVRASADQRELAAVLTHEIGHALGLLHPCEADGRDGAPECVDNGQFEETTMFPFYSPAQTSLEVDDAEGICELYGGSPNACGVCDAGRFCVDGVCVLLCDFALCGAGETCGARGCVAEGTCTRLDCAGEKCEADADCGPTSRCRDGRCIRGGASMGDACHESWNCRAGACVQGMCESECTGEGPCGASAQGLCVAATEDGVFGCQDSGEYSFGASCVRGEQCASGICVSTRDEAVCTEECWSDADCTAGTACLGVDGRLVCVRPALTASGGGCGLVSPLSSAWPPAHWIIAAILVTAVGRRKTTRERKR